MEFKIVRGKAADLPLTPAQNHDRAIFDAINDWAEQAKASSSENSPDIAPLLDGLKERSAGSFWYDGETKDFRNRLVVVFGIGANTNAHKRKVLPIHFVIMATLSLVPGMSLKMIDKTKGRGRSPDEQIHIISLNISPGKKRRLKTFGTTSMFRILFNAPSDASIRERRGKDFRFLIPDHFILERYRTQNRADIRTQRDVIKAVTTLLNDPPRQFPLRHPFKAREMASLLRSLFGLADDWYWADLLDRLKRDHSYGRLKEMCMPAASS